MRPLVLAPQTKNVPARTQNAGDRIASAQRGERRQRAPAARVGDPAARPYGSSPRSCRPVAHEDQHDDEDDDRRAGDDQRRRRAIRCRSTTPASSGRNTSCPVAFAAESAPSTSAAPRVEPARRHDRGQHHRRDAGAGADADAPQQRHLPLVAACGVVSATETASSAQRARTRRRRPQRSIADAANGPMSPNSAMLMATAAEMAARLQPNSALERHHQHARASRGCRR